MKCSCQLSCLDEMFFDKNDFNKYIIDTETMKISLRGTEKFRNIAYGITHFKGINANVYDNTVILTTNKCKHTIHVDGTALDVSSEVKDDTALDVSSEVKGCNMYWMSVGSFEHDDNNLHLSLVRETSEGYEIVIAVVSDSSTAVQDAFIGLVIDKESGHILKYAVRDFGEDDYELQVSSDRGVQITSEEVLSKYKDVVYTADNNKFLDSVTMEYISNIKGRNVADLNTISMGYLDNGSVEFKHINDGCGNGHRFSKGGQVLELVKRWGKLFINGVRLSRTIRDLRIWGIEKYGDDYYAIDFVNDTDSHLIIYVDKLSLEPCFFKTTGGMKIIFTNDLNKAIKVSMLVSDISLEEGEIL